MPWPARERDDLVHVVEHRLLHAGRRGRTVLRPRSTRGSSAAAPSTIRRCVRWHRSRRCRVRPRPPARPGRAGRRCHAVHSPVSPPPTIATSTSRSRSRDGKGDPFVLGERVRPDGAAVVDVVPAMATLPLNVGGGGRPQAGRVTVRSTTGMSTFPPPTTAPAGWYPDPDERRHALLRRSHVGADPTRLRGARGAPGSAAGGRDGRARRARRVAVGRPDVGRRRRRASGPT